MPPSPPRSPSCPPASAGPSDPTRRAVLALATTACLLTPPTASGADAGPAAGDAPVHALWNAVPLRTWADRATAIAGRPVVIDRRLDPDAAVTRDCRGEPLGEVLAAVATGAGGTVEPLRSWIRIGPAASAGRAAQGERERTAELARLPAPARTALAGRAPWSWPDGARPRDLVAAATAAEGIALSGMEAVPHDHLPAATLPPLTLAERLDLLLAHYDLRVAWTPAADPAAAAGRIVPLADGPAPARGGGGVADRPRGAAGRKPAAIDRYTLTLEAPLDEALGALGPRLGLEPEIDRASLAARGVLPGEIVRARVTDASRDQLLDAIVTPLGLRWRIMGRRLVIDAPP